MKYSIVALLSLLFFVVFNFYNHFFLFLQDTSIFLILLVLSPALILLFYDNRANINIKKTSIRSMMYCAVPIIFTFLMIYIFAIIVNAFIDSSAYGVFISDYFIILCLVIIVIPTFSFLLCNLATQQSIKESYIYIGQCMMQGQWREVLKNKKFMLSLLLKMVFIPYMYGNLSISIAQLFQFDVQYLSIQKVIELLFVFGITIDLLIASVGYILCSKLFSNEIISIDQTFLGWLVCLLCYPPLNILRGYIVGREHDYIWTDWLTPNHFLFWIWGGAIVLTWIFYWIATVNFGFKFSNLTWRGLVNVGMYRYVKHPSYLSKNIYWWLYMIPFIATSVSQAIVNCLLLLSTNLIYYLRAKTEERHLMQFEEYRQYNEWIKQHGLWAKIKGIF